MCTGAHIFKWLGWSSWFEIQHILCLYYNIMTDLIQLNNEWRVYSYIFKHLTSICKNGHQKHTMTTENVKCMKYNCHYPPTPPINSSCSIPITLPAGWCGYGPYVDGALTFIPFAFRPFSLAVGIDRQTRPFTQNAICLVWRRRRIPDDFKRNHPKWWYKTHTPYIIHIWKKKIRYCRYFVGKIYPIAVVIVKSNGDTRYARIRPTSPNLTVIDLLDTRALTRILAKLTATADGRFSRSLPANSLGRAFDVSGSHKTFTKKKLNTN